MSGTTPTLQFIRLLACGMALILLGGCAAIRVGDADPHAAFAERRGDYLTTGTFSAETRSQLFALGSAAHQCRERPAECLPRLRRAGDSVTDTSLSVLAELSIAKALQTERAGRGENSEGVIADYLEAARFAYAFLFLGARDPADRAFENRQTQVRDYYNFATERVAALVFERTPRVEASPVPVPGTGWEIGGWRVGVGRVDVRLPIGAQRLESIVSPSRLQIRGLRNTYRRDGLGADLVAVWTPDSAAEPEVPIRELGFSAATVLLEFEGEGLDQLFSQRAAQLNILDPYGTRTTSLRDHTVAVAADFSAPLALWLSRGRFQRRALLGTLGRDASLTSPEVRLMQPYDPERATVIMLHGLASSPLAWATLANEVLGDEVLRDRFQFWQVHYPTNLPIAINQLQIRQALEHAVAELDARGTRANRDIVLIGHSMGGVIARMLILEGSDDVWMETLGLLPDSDRRHALATLEPFIDFEPIAGVSRAVFLAAPHAGTPFAGNWLSRLVTGLVRLPAEVMLKISAMAEAVASDLPETSERLRAMPTSIDQLDARDPFLQATSRLKIASGIPYHSIIARRDPRDPPESSSDGVVPFTSAYLPGAESTLLVTSGHSVQQTPEAIVEIRRILHLHLEERGIRATEEPPQAGAD